jgi:hypothetical protein
LPSPADAVKLLMKQGVKNVKIYDVDHKVLDAFHAHGKGIKLSVTVPNEEVPAMANDRDFPGHWVDKNMVKYKDMITSIAVGNEWLHEGHDPELLVPAMKHLHKASEILEILASLSS